MVDGLGVSSVKLLRQTPRFFGCGVHGVFFLSCGDAAVDREVHVERLVRVAVVMRRAVALNVC